MNAPDPVMPGSGILPALAWLGVLLVALIVTVRHAVVRKRWAWVAAIILLPVLGSALYWLVEACRAAGGGRSPELAAPA